jgi:MoaA/NifB/PqqE/SkfB family radical SAM enzyme
MKRKTEIIISSVITPENIPDIYDVYHFAQNNNLKFAVYPQLIGVKPAKELFNNKEYKEFFEYLSNEKKQGARVQPTLLTLKYLRDLKKFECNPFTMLCISPEGRIFYPCLEKGLLLEKVSEVKSLHSQKKLGHKRFGPKPKCGNQCHSACALGFSLILKYPASMLVEGYHQLKMMILSRNKNNFSNKES